LDHQRLKPQPIFHHQEEAKTVGKKVDFRIKRHLRSCPTGWCRIGYLIALSGLVGRFYQAATAGSLMMGSLHKPAMVSSVM
jgi:hypothetical protein